MDIAKRRAGVEGGGDALSTNVYVSGDVYVSVASCRTWARTTDISRRRRQAVLGRAELAMVFLQTPAPVIAYELWLNARFHEALSRICCPKVDLRTDQDRWLHFWLQ